MAATRKFSGAKSAVGRRQKDGTNQGSGGERHLLWGSSGSGSSEWRYRSFIEFTHNWDGIARVVKVELAIKTEDDSNHFGFGTKPKVRVRRLDAEFATGNNAENVWDSSDYTWPASDGGKYADKDLPINPSTGKPQDEAWVFIDVTAVMKPMIPSSIYVGPTGTAVGGQPSGKNYNHGFMLMTAGDEWDGNTTRGIAKSKDHPTTADRPYLLVTYDPKNRPPDAPTLTGPGTTNNTFGESFTGVHSDPDGDPMAKREIVVWPKGVSTAGKEAWKLPADLQSAGSDEVPTGTFSVPLSLAAGSLKLATDYEWVARTCDPAGSWGPYSARRALRITSSAPTVTATPVGSVDSMTKVALGGVYADAESNPPILYRVQVMAGSGSDWSDPTTYVWDTGEIKPTLQEQTSGKLAVPYGGRALDPATYQFRIQAQDSTGVWSAWSQSSFILTTAYDPGDPGAIDLLTQVLRRAPVRVHLWAITLNKWRVVATATGGSFTLTHAGVTSPSIAYNATDATMKARIETMIPGATATVTRTVDGDKRTWNITISYAQPVRRITADFGPLTGADNSGSITSTSDRSRGPEIGWVDDPMELGGASFLNSGGEMYFTLPALHPYVPSIEPHQVHYAVEQYYGDRYVEKFAGIVTDFDAGPDEVVFYGTDYLGLLQTAVDERYNPEKAEQAAPTGSKYNSQTIDYIIKDQLNYHRGLSNSPVKFINMGVFSALAERVTIYSTYTEALPFINGLIDSHKAGTGREARFYVKTKADGTREFTLTDNWGKDRPAIRLEYGGLLNDFRVVALGDFGTRVLGIGQKRGEVKVYRATGSGGLSEDVFGRVAKTQFWQDINDQADLQRRVNEAASQLAKVGKRIALAIKVGALSPFDGWDVGDNIQIDIRRGAVDTPGYGSAGYWTIYGVEWRYHTDGHDELTLTVLPKKVAGTLDPDLIPSAAPGVGLAWQVGYGIPTAYGELPGPSDGSSLMSGPSMSLLSTTYQPPSDYTAQAKQWQDLNTGKVYELDDAIDGATGDPINPATYGTYVEVFTPPEGGGGQIIIPDTDPLPTLPDATYPPGTTVSWQGKLWVVSGDGTTWLDQSASSGADDTPGAPTIISLGSRLTPDQDGRLVVALMVDVTHPTTNTDASPLEDLFGTTVQITSDSDGNPDPSLAVPDWTDPTASSMISPSGVHAEITGLAGSTRYWARAQASDVWGNRGPYSAVVSVVTLRDTDAPSVPAGLDAWPGYRIVGLNWSPAVAPDFNFNEVRYAPDLRTDPTGPLLGPDTTAQTWTNPIRVKANTLVITNLDAGSPAVPATDTDPAIDATPAVTYHFQVRAIDQSSNVATSVADPTAVDYLSNPDAGWCDPVTETPGLIGVEDLALNELLTNMLHSGVIDAGSISGGSLKISTDGGATGIEVWNGDVRVGFWDETGLYVGDTAEGLPIDPATGLPDLDAVDYVKVHDAGVSVYEDGVEKVAITPQGINASVINFGALPGGQNLVRNSSFELAPYSTTTPIPKDWNVAADWTGTQQANTNATNGAGAVTATGTSY